jgi:hypothetical protein
MSNATISGRERQCQAMSRLRVALRCMVMLDIKSFRTPPRLTAAPSKFVMNHTHIA